jgi:hypothetical protein
MYEILQEWDVGKETRTVNLAPKPAEILDYDRCLNENWRALSPLRKHGTYTLSFFVDRLSNEAGCGATGSS